MKPVTVINLFGGPGCGKSTGAAYIFAKLKMVGVNAELVTEFAKDKTWERNSKALTCQPYVFGKQVYRIDRCADQVDVIVTDSPIVLTLFYNQDQEIEPEFSQMVIKKFNEFNNYNFFLKRLKEYNPIGRNQTEDEAKIIDNNILNMFKQFNIPYEEMSGNTAGYEEIVKKVLKILQK